MTRDVERIGGAPAAKKVFVQCITGVEQVLELVGTEDDYPLRLTLKPRAIRARRSAPGRLAARTVGFFSRRAGRAGAVHEPTRRPAQPAGNM